MIALLGFRRNARRKSLMRTTQECSEQILEAAPYKNTSVRPLTVHLTNYPSETSKMGQSWSLLVKKRRTQRLCSFMDFYIRTHQC